MSSPRAREGLLIIGYGNQLRGDDAAGQRAAGRLAKRGFDAIAVHQLTPELAERVAAAREVIFIDASAEVAPGSIAVEPVYPGEAAPSVLEHHASPAGLLLLARDVYGATPAAKLISVGGERFELGEPMSARAKRGVAKAVAEVVRGAERGAG
ncbi:MAG: hydrogenase maturation protease [Acidobacteriia bacterium]|nr:hydrogenase maturation protease [Terriglobia bacterium]